MAARVELGEMDAKGWLQCLAIHADPLETLRKVVGNEADDWQREFFRVPKDEPLVQVLCSRGLGKSLVAAVRAVTHADKYDKQTILILAPTLKQSAELFRYCMLVLDVLGLAHPIVRQTQTMLELQNGSRIIILSGANPDSVRGFRAHLIICDEAARVSDEMFAVALPILLQSGQLIALTTPAGRTGWFAELWQEDKAYKITARSPDIPRMLPIVERDRKFLTEAQFNTEVMLQWQGSGDPFFRYSTLQKAFNTGRKAMQFSFLPGRSHAEDSHAD